MTDHGYDPLDDHDYCLDGVHYELDESNELYYVGTCEPIMCSHVSYPSDTPCGYECGVWNEMGA